MAVWGWALSCERMIPSESIPEHFDFMARRSTPSHQKTNHTSLLCLPQFPMLDEHILHCAHPQSNKETTVWTCAFSLSTSPTLQMAVSIHNSVANFCQECVLCRVLCFHLTATYSMIAPVAVYDGCGSVAFVYWLRLK